MERKTALRLTFNVLALLVVAVFAARALWDVSAGQASKRSSTRLAQKYGSLDPASLRPEPVPDQRNRVPLIRAATLALTLADEVGRQDSNEAWLVGEVIRKDDSDLLVEKLDPLRGIIERNATVLELLGQAADRPDANWNIDYESGAAAGIPNLLAIVKTGKLVGATALVQIHDGETATAARTIELGFVMAGSMQQESILIMQLIRLAVNHMMYDATQELLRHGVDDPAVLERLDAVIAREALPVSMQRGYLGEMKAMHKLFEQIEFGNPETVGIDVYGDNAIFRWLMRPLIRVEHQYVMQRFDEMIRYDRTPLHKRAGLFATNPFVSEVLPWWRPYSKVMLPNLENATMRGDLDRTRHVLARTALALRRQRLDRGSYPRELDWLATKYLDRPPADPFSGEALLYERDASGVMLASVARDVELTGLMSSMDQQLEWFLPR